MIEDYIEQHIDEEPEYLKRLYRDAHRQLLYTRMMSGHLQGRLLKMLTQMARPKRVLELGAFAGYSTLCIAEGLQDGGVLDTVEIDDELEGFLTEHFVSSPFESRINLHIGDALDVVPRLYENGVRWDMVFMDADKRLYPEYYDMLVGRLASGSWIIADNTLWNGMVAAQGNVVKENHKTSQLRGIEIFNDIVASDSRVEKVILPLRDGLSIIRIK